MTANIKTVFNHSTKGQDIRRFQLGSLEKPYDQLLGFLTEVYQLSPEKFTCKYRDDDGDDCSISSNIELIEAFRITHQEGKGVLKVEVSVDEDQNSLALERTHSGSSDDFVKVEAESETKENETKIPAKSDATVKVEEQVGKDTTLEEIPSISSSEPTAVPESKESVIEIVPIHEETLKTTEVIQSDSSILAPTQAEISHVSLNSVDLSDPSTEEKRVEQVVTEAKCTEPIVEEQQSAEPVIEEEQIFEEKQISEPIEEKQKFEVTAFPSRVEFFSLLADFLHDSKVMEFVQLVLPGLLKILDEDVNRPPAVEILKNIFDFAPVIKESSLCQRLLPFTNQLAADPKMLPLVKDAIRKLHDGSKLASFFRSGPKGSIPYMPDFVRLFNYMNTLVAQGKENEEKESVKQPEPHRPVVHRGVTCDGCQLSPIQGNRYKCYVCPDFDLCEMCEDANKHRADHPMLKIRSPLPNRSCATQNRKPCLPRAWFIGDVTLRDGISCYPGITVVKTWALKNGDVQWPLGVQLLFLSGDLAPERLMEVPRAEPGAIVHVSAEIKLPMTPKQYTGYYRLATADGKKFGPRIWVDLIVVSGKEPEKEAKKELEQPQKELEQPKKEAEQPKKEPEQPQKEVEKESELPKREAEKEPTQPENSDGKVDSSKILTEVPIQIIPSTESQPDVKQGHNVDKVDAKKAEEPVSNLESSEPKEANKPDQPSKKQDEQPKVQSPFAQQLEILAGMGFQETELNSYLLANNEGNVQRVVEWILSHGVN